MVFIMPQVNIKKLNENAVIPTYGSEYAAGADLYACIDEAVTITPHTPYLVKTGLITMSQLVEKMSLNPARILGIKAGAIDVDMPADIALVNADEQWVVDENKLHGKSKNTPFKGKTLTGKVKMTLLGGRVVFEDK